MRSLRADGDIVSIRFGDDPSRLKMHGNALMALTG